MSNQDTVDKYINAACDQFNSMVKHPKVLEVVSENLYEELLEEVILEISYDIHRIYKRGYLNLFSEDYELNQESFETPYNNQDSIKCVCPICKRKVVSNRYGTHLATCMGFHRNSSRLASIKNTNISIDNDNENEFAQFGKRKRKKRNNNKRKHKNVKTDFDSRSVGSSSGYASASSSQSQITELKSKQICGVITKHSKKNCKNIINCTHHVEQRKFQKIEGDFVTIDIETHEDANSEVTRDSLDLNSNTSSPTSFHGSAKKRCSSSKNKNKSKKN